jgi:formylglycine-generating enzyme required for sulfatase activity
VPGFCRQHRRRAVGVGAFLLAILPLPVALTAPALSPGPETEPRVDPAVHRNYTETIPGTDPKVRFDMVAVPGGVFWMGSPEGEKGRGDDEGPRHPVRIRPFWMGKCEVTWDEYDLYSKEDNPPKPNPAFAHLFADAVSRPSPPYIDETFGHGREHHPVLSISHHAAMEYCRWLSMKTGKVYRLPTEAEWEWAARAGTQTPYSFGSDPRQLGDYAWFADNADDFTHPVGKKKPNPWGLHDMYGNVAEWCLDHYRKDAYASRSVTRLTLAPVELPTADRWPDAVRGGSWADAPDRCRSAARRMSHRAWNRHDPGRPQSIWWLSGGDFVGFRVVRAVEEQDNLKEIRSKVTPESK